MNNTKSEEIENLLKRVQKRNQKVKQLSKINALVCIVILIIALFNGLVIILIIAGLLISKLIDEWTLNSGSELVQDRLDLLDKEISLLENKFNNY